MAKWLGFLTCLFLNNIGGFSKTEWIGERMGALLLLKLCGPIWTYESLWHGLQRTFCNKQGACLLTSLSFSPFNVVVKLPVFWAPAACLAMCWVEMQWWTGQSLCFGVEDTGNKLLCVVVCSMTWINRGRRQRVAVRNGHDSDKMAFRKTFMWSWHLSES